MAVQASTHQAAFRFGGSGRQCTCNVLKAFMKNCSKKFNSRLPSDIDKILDKGDKIYMNIVQGQYKYLLLD